ncbi:apoptosis-inducing factor 3 [Methylomarinovum tepidoasis]|uniref:Apoptosis-inducing factor 3 n=1 Tax=Methylomarinovum tepidoasis TaxID=2840183 RepID=A0AAU9C9A4_9GAMM|nr:apoptosis inducing factor family protein [Methylomarinovum sp. IN45]BCX88436.1 apoptosis-inducing factor 3 [Methylomarinovum sp. IN45]
MAEFKVARETDLAVGRMKQVQAGTTAVLLLRLEDGFHALGALCPHYEAPLAAGALCDGRIVCPWHHACFDARSGALLEPPGLDGLPVYPVRVDDGEVWVTIPEQSQPPPPPRRDPADSRLCVVIGGGCAGAYAVEALRDHGFGGRIVWVTGPEFPPIDRPLLSKGYLSGEAPESWLPLRAPDFYTARDIEVVEAAATALAADARQVTLSDGTALAYDAAILASGAVNRRPPIPGVDLDGVFFLRSRDDGEHLRQAAESARRAVVVGAGFIGMEVAQSLRRRDIEVTVVAPETVPFERVLGPEIGAALHRLHEDHGVAFRLGRTVKAFQGAGRVERVSLDDGSELPADLVVVGVGVRPATDFVTGVSKADDGAILVDAGLRAAEGLYAAGDLACFPDWRSGAPIRVEHWRMAAQHGRLAGANVAGAGLEYRGVPYFWTRQYNRTLQYFGHAADWDEIRYDGDPAGYDFIAYFVRDGQVHAVAGMERERELAELEERMRREGLWRL